MDISKAILLVCVMLLTGAAGPVLATDCSRFNGAPREDGKTDAVACPHGGHGGTDVASIIKGRVLAVP